MDSSRMGQGAILRRNETRGVKKIRIRANLNSGGFSLVVHSPAFVVLSSPGFLLLRAVTAYTLRDKR